MAKYKIVKGSFGIGSDIYKAATKNDIIESDKDLSKRDGIEKFTEIEKKVVNIDDTGKEKKVLTEEEIFIIRKEGKSLKIKSSHNMGIDKLILKIAKSKDKSSKKK